MGYFWHSSFFIMIFLVASLFAEDDKADTATVTHLRGKVTVLPPHQKEAKPLKKGDTLLEDSSVLTYNKSFARIKFQDGSNITISPNSKTIIRRYKKKQPKLLNLIKGKMRSFIQPKDDKKYKALIQTRNTVLAVRGTEFISTYNEKNQTSSILTLKGKVDITPTEKMEPLKDVPDESFFRKKTTRTVGLGEFSKNNQAQKLSRPVRVSLNQYSKIRSNKTFSEKSKAEMEKEIKQAKEDYKKVRTENTTKKSRLGLPGGFVDLDKGIYVAPAKETSKFNKATKVYEDSEPIGKVNELGAYEPPKGVELDAVKGFVVVDKDKVSEKVQKRIKVKNEMIKFEAGPIKNNLKESYDKFFD